MGKKAQRCNAWLEGSTPPILKKTGGEIFFASKSSQSLTDEDKMGNLQPKIFLWGLTVVESIKLITSSCLQGWMITYVLFTYLCTLFLTFKL